MNQPIILFMKEIQSTYTSQLGTSHTETRVRQAVASATLEGLTPSKRTIDLVRSIASGSMSTDKALNTLRGYYARHA